MSCVVLMGLPCVHAHMLHGLHVSGPSASAIGWLAGAAPHADGAEWRRRCCKLDGMTHLVTENAAAGAGAARRAVELACCALRCIIIMLSKSLRSSGDEARCDGVLNLLPGVRDLVQRVDGCGVALVSGHQRLVKCAKQLPCTHAVVPSILSECTHCSST